MSHRIPALMTPDRWARLRELLDHALDAPEQRAELLDQVQAEDPDLCKELKCLIDEYEASGGETEAMASVDAFDPAGERIGAYDLVRELGRGGMGTVFLAVRADDDVRVPVALKLLRQSFLADQPDKSVRHERRMLAQMNHPGIARLLDWGTLAGGMLYLVLEFVDGEPITAFCERHKLPLTSRLELFLQVCDAVEHAHQRLIVHRDLKPGNILVSADGRVKLLDFGIAVALDAVAMQTTVRLTPAYASPEQLLGRPVTVAADIYSLGVLLYQMLAGRLPYRTDSVEAVLREQPEAPSGRTSEGGVGRKEVAGDLDAIVLKAMRKEPDLRYPSVEQMAADLRRFQAGLPVNAVPDSRRYRIDRFLRRHRPALAFSTLAVVLLIAATAVSVWKRRDAENSLRLSEQRLRALQDFAIYSTTHAAGGVEGGRRAAATALQYLERAGTPGYPDDDLQREIAAAYQRLGDLQGQQMAANAGDTAGALESYWMGHKILLSQWKAQRAKMTGCLLLSNYGRIANALSDSRQAADFVLEAQPISDWLLSHYPGDVEVLHVTASEETIRGQRVRGAGDFGAALAAFHKAMALSDRGLSIDPNSQVLLNQRETSESEASGVLRFEGRLDEALAAVLEARQFAVRSVELGRTTHNRRQLAFKSLVASDILRLLKRYREASAFADGALAELERIATEDPSNQQAQSDVSLGYLRRGDIQFDQGQREEALQSHRQAMQIRKEQADRDRHNIRAQDNYVISLNRVARSLLAMGRDLPSAQANFDSAIQLGKLTLASSPSSLSARRELAYSYFGKAQLFMRTADSPDAANLLRQSVDTWRDVRSRCPLDVELAAGTRQAETLLAQLQVKQEGRSQSGSR
jgi:serine/threonine protein kinase